MQAWMILPYFVLCAVLLDALFVKAKILPASCSHCGRRADGQACACEHARF